MNTVVRALPRHEFARRTETKKFLYKQFLQMLLLTFLVLFLAFTVIYIKDLYRRMFIHYQTLQDQQNQLYVDWGKLLLEQSTWSTQARVQKIATERLGMEAPQSNEVQLVN